jgi:ribosomal protein L40E
MDKLSCPTCGGTALEMQDSGEILCTACDALFVLTPSQADSLSSCPECGFRNLPGASSCSKCGAELLKYCPKCGAGLVSDMRFCDQCGANYDASSTPNGLCQWCGAQNARESTECQECGARLIAICPSCGAETKAGVEFCRACGLAFETLLEAQEEQPPKRRRWPWSRRSSRSDEWDIQD